MSEDQKPCLPCFTSVADLTWGNIKEPAHKLALTLDKLLSAIVCLCLVIIILMLTHRLVSGKQGFDALNRHHEGMEVNRMGGGPATAYGTSLKYASARSDTGADSRTPLERELGKHEGFVSGEIAAPSQWPPSQENLDYEDQLARELIGEAQ